MIDVVNATNVTIYLVKPKKIERSWYESLLPHWVTLSHWHGSAIDGFARQTDHRACFSNVQG